MRYVEDTPVLYDRVVSQYCGFRLLCLLLSTSAAPSVCKYQRSVQRAGAVRPCDSAPRRVRQVQYLQCPACQAIYGRKVGTQPPGRMSTRRLPIPLPGHDCDTIEISYM